MLSFFCSFICSFFPSFVLTLVHFISYFLLHSHVTPACLLAPLHSEELGKFMESQGASVPGILTLTTSLSKPFMRLDKYPTLLQELERHVEVPAWGAFNLHPVDDFPDSVRFERARVSTDPVCGCACRRRPTQIMLTS